MYGNKIFLTGLAIELLLAPIVNIPAAVIVGAVLSLLGICLIWLDK